MTNSAIDIKEIEQEQPEGYLCPLCPDHDPFASADALKMHNLAQTRLAKQGKPTTHAGLPSDDPELDASVTPPPALVAANGETLATMTPEALAQIDMIGRVDGAGAIDESIAGILARQKANGGTWDPVTLKRVVVLGGRIRVRQTVGGDALKGEAEHLDFFHPEFGWIREGFIIERGRMHPGVEYTTYEGGVQTVKSGNLVL